MPAIANPMKPKQLKNAFSLVEMLVVIAIISILMTAGITGLQGMGGKGVTSGVATAESVFDEARATAMGKNVRSCVLVARDLTNNPTENLRRLVVAYEELETDPSKTNFGQAKDPTNKTPNWVLASRSVLLPDQTFFSQQFSSKTQTTMTALDAIDSTKIVACKPSYAGSYYIYRFNAQGIMIDPNLPTYQGGASFIIGNGTRKLTQKASDDLGKPRVTGNAKKDFGGFVVWRNGSTSLFRSPDQIGDEIKNIKPGDKF